MQILISSSLSFDRIGRHIGNHLCLSRQRLRPIVTGQLARFQFNPLVIAPYSYYGYNENSLPCTNTQPSVRVAHHTCSLFACQVVVPVT